MLSPHRRTIAHAIDAAVETPDADLGFYGLMALIGLYVGVIPVALGMLWLPWCAASTPRWLRFLMALTVGLLGFLAIEAPLEGTELARRRAPQALGARPRLARRGGRLPGLTGVDAWLREPRGACARARSGRRRRAGALIALGIGLHNLGEGLAIGSAYAVGRWPSAPPGRRLRPAQHHGGPGHRRADRARGQAAGADARAARTARRRPGGARRLDRRLRPSTRASPRSCSALGAGAIVQVIVQLAPQIRARPGRALTPGAPRACCRAACVMYGTGLLVSV